MNLKKIVLIASLIGLVVIGVFAYSIYNKIFSPNTAFNNNEAYIFVSTGATFQDVFEELSPLLKDKESFIEVATKKGYVNNVKAGKYRITKGMSNNDIVNSIRIKNIPIQLAFNNQERLQDLAGRIATQIEADSATLYQSMIAPDFLAENGFDEATALAMYLPNTYEFFWNTSAKDFRDRMLKEYKSFWTPERIQQAKNQDLTPIQVSVLAAIVQKETAMADERPRVAGVYLNRLHKDWNLEADPTVIFAQKKHVNNYDLVIKRVLYKHLELDSPYNTYMYGGLPPGLIAMPDISSIKAVLQPEDHDYFFFVASTENFGYHKFAKTHAQHIANSRAYQAWVAKQGY